MLPRDVIMFRALDLEAGVRGSGLEPIRLTIFIYHYAVEFVLFLNAFNWYSIGVIVDVIAHI